MKKKTGLREVAKCFSIDFNPNDTSNILDVHAYLIRRTWYKIMFGLIKKIFTGLIACLVNGSNHAKCFLSNLKI